MKIINDWIKSGKNYHVGVAIYKTIGKNNSLKELFTKGKTPFSIRTLEKELCSMVQPDKAPIAIFTAENIPQTNDQVLESIRNSWMPKYQRMNYLRHQMDKHKGNSADAISMRKDMAFEILQLEQECMDLWNKADQYQKNGTMPVSNVPGEMDVPEDPFEKAKAIENTKRNIRRNRQEMKKNPSNSRLPILYDKYKDFYFRLTGEHYQELT